MHASVILLMLMFVGVSSQNATQVRDAKAIEAAKNANVHQIESSLPDQPFAQWLRQVVGAQAEIKWEVNDCGEQTGNPSLDKGRDFPMCVEAQATLAGKRKLFVSLSVGTFKDGVKTGTPSFSYALIVEPDGSRKLVKSLAQLPDAIKTAK